MQLVMVTDTLYFAARCVCETQCSRRQQNQHKLYLEQKSSLCHLKGFSSGTYMPNMIYLSHSYVVQVLQRSLKLTTNFD